MFGAKPDMLADTLYLVHTRKGCQTHIAPTCTLNHLHYACLYLALLFYLRVQTTKDWAAQNNPPSCKYITTEVSMCGIST